MMNRGGRSAPGRVGRRMEDRRPMRRPSSALDQQSLGLWIALTIGLLAVALFGTAPLALAVGLVALLVID
jgi:hypothetical protein